ncbi:hypothetical protein KR76_00007 [Pimelobacter simplex]|uniref:Uncharacterized protein n=1 Tax=Nocardioides simplex TaxID=2045 RepID=A0A0C5WXI2_NOCSI|nr:hypothetical protein KR76_00007 [Pimelobacter simplex]
MRASFQVPCGVTVEDQTGWLHPLLVVPIEAAAGPVLPVGAA